MKRAEILEAARVCVCGERQQDYGTPENNFETIGLLCGASTCELLILSWLRSWQSTTSTPKTWLL